MDVGMFRGKPFWVHVWKVLDGDSLLVCPSDCPDRVLRFVSPVWMLLSPGSPGASRLWSISGGVLWARISPSERLLVRGDGFTGFSTSPGSMTLMWRTS